MLLECHRMHTLKVVEGKGRLLTAAEDELLPFLVAASPSFLAHPVSFRHSLLSSPQVSVHPIALRASLDRKRLWVKKHSFKCYSARHLDG